MQSNWQSMKGVVRENVAAMLHLSNLRRVCHKGKVAILAYHRVLPEHELLDHWIQPGMYVEAGVFEQHMLFLQAEFRVISFGELLERWSQRDWDREERYCVVTFDDGWLDNYRHAFPILRKLGIPATIFLPTDFIGTREWFWPEQVTYCIKEMTGSEESAAKGNRILNNFLGIGVRNTSCASLSENGRRNCADQVIERCKHYEPKTISEFIDRLSTALEIAIPQERCTVDWDEVAEMAHDRISFGSHSCSHRILTHLSVADVQHELEESRQSIMARSESYVPVFCYPNGNNTPQIQAMVKECGYHAAVGVQSGLEGAMPRHLFGLRRISIHNDITYTIPLYAMRLFAS